MLLQDPAALVERLRTGDIEDRQGAEAALVRLGPAAEEALDRASRDVDPELSARARGLLLRAVAVHRKDVLRELRHIGRHLSDASRLQDVDELAALTRSLGRMDPEHPLLQGFTISRLCSLERDFRPPGREAWERVREKVAEGVEKSSYRKTCAECVGRRLGKLRIGFSFENAGIEDILAYLGKVGDLLIEVDAGEFFLERAMTVAEKDAPLGEALGRVLAAFELEWRVTAEGVVLVQGKGPASD